MAIKKIKIGSTEHELQTTIANVDNLQATLDSKVPTSRTINGKALSGNISLTASDVGAAKSSHTHNYAGSSSAGGAANGAKYLVPTDNTATTTYGASTSTCSATDTDNHRIVWREKFVNSDLNGDSGNIVLYLNKQGDTSSALNVAIDGNFYANSGSQVAIQSEVDSALAGKSSSSHTHTVSHTPAGTVSQPTFTGSSATSGAPSKTTSVYSITGVGSVPSLTASVTNKCLTLTFSAGSVPTRSSVTVASSDHTHSVTAKGSVSQPTFTGTAATLTSSFPK